LTGYDNSKAIRTSSYLIDQFEVTNREFKEFVDAGGYAKQDYWKQPFIREGRTMSWSEAMDLFTDPTGRPGPATWDVGTFPKDQEDYPVGGVSWYEAAAYAEFRGKTLPTVYHWVKAASTGLAADITPLSNIRGSRLQPVGQSQAVSAYGLADVAGNVKEWVWNEQQPRVNRYVLGGAWNEPDYMFLEGEARSPFDRSANLGFRCARYTTADSAPPATFEPIARFVRDYSVEKPPPDEIFKVYKELFSYDHTPLDAKVEAFDDGSKLWRHEKVSFNATYGKDRVTAHLFLPRDRTPPYQVVLYWPPSGVIRAPSGDRMMETFLWDFLVTSGRAVLAPIYYGTYERNDGTRQDSWPDVSRAYRDWAIKQVQDARRALDYVDTRTDLARAGVGYLGYSWGGRMGPVLLAQEPRLKAAVLGGGGLSPGPAPPEVDGLTFAPRVSIPVLMFNGASDLIFQLEQGQKPLFNALGTAAENKRHTVLPGGHTVFIEKRSQFIREALDWFDRYLGPVH
jgi:dienelactone hydrolase